MVASPFNILRKASLLTASVFQKSCDLCCVLQIYRLPLRAPFLVWEEMRDLKGLPPSSKDKLGCWVHKNRWAVILGHLFFFFFFISHLFTYVIWEYSNTCNFCLTVVSTDSYSLEAMAMPHKDLIKGLLNLMSYHHLGSVNIYFSMIHLFFLVQPSDFFLCYCIFRRCSCSGTAPDEAGTTTFISWIWRCLRGASPSPQ